MLAYATDAGVQLKMKAGVLSQVIGVRGIPDICLRNQSHLGGNTFPPPELQLLSFCFGP